MRGEWWIGLTVGLFFAAWVCWAHGLPLVGMILLSVAVVTGEVAGIICTWTALRSRR